MKRINILFGTALLCASTAFISCSSDSDDVIQNNSEAAQIAPQTITVAAPTISADGTDAKTRIAYTNGDDKISMEWASGDQIKVVTYLYKSGNWNRDSKTATFSWSNGNTFNKIGDNAPNTNNGTDRGQVISYNVGTYGQVSEFESKTTSVTQTQAGNDNIGHLSAYYHAMLQYVNKYENPVFSSEWAEATAQKCSSAPEGSAKFYQSSILMFDLNLPVDANLSTGVTKLEVIAKTSGGDASNIFYTTNNHSDSPVNTITLNFSGITSSMSGQTLTGYFALPAADWTISDATKLSLRVYYGSNAGDYIEKRITINDAVTLNAGKLGKIATSNKGWSKTWTFADGYDITEKVQEMNGLYVHGDKTLTWDAIISAESTSGTFDDGTEWNAAYGLKFGDGRDITDLSGKRVNSEDVSSSYSFKPEKSGKLYIVAGTIFDNSTINIMYNGSDGVGAYSSIGSFTVTKVNGTKFTPVTYTCDVTVGNNENGVVYIAGTVKNWGLIYLKFVPNN